LISGWQSAAEWRDQTIQPDNIKSMGLAIATTNPYASISQNEVMPTIYALLTN